MSYGFRLLEVTAISSLVTIREVQTVHTLSSVLLELKENQNQLAFYTIRSRSNITDQPNV